MIKSFDEIKKQMSCKKVDINSIREDVLDTLLSLDKDLKKLEHEKKMLLKRIQSKDKSILRNKDNYTKELDKLKNQLRDVRAGTSEGQYINELLDEIERKETIIQQNVDEYEGMTRDLNMMADKNMRLKAELASMFRSRR